MQATFETIPPDFFYNFTLAHYENNIALICGPLKSKPTVNGVTVSACTDKDRAAVLAEIETRMADLAESSANHRLKYQLFAQSRARFVKTMGDAFEKQRIAVMEAIGKYNSFTSKCEEITSNAALLDAIHDNTSFLG